jgi:glutamine amidotransferase
MIQNMCRLAAYVGPGISLEHFLLRPAHGLPQQSWQPREMTGGTINADGYGFGWFDPERQPARYAHALPIWSDINLPALARSLFSRVWLANVRSATPPSANHPANTQPFANEEFLFLHNGHVGEFVSAVRPHLRRFLAPEVEGTINGDTDSEYLFALLRQILRQDIDMPVDEGVMQMFTVLEERVGHQRALLNIVLSDGERLYAARHALNGDCPSLYFTTDDDDYPDGLLVASEPLTDSRFWQAVPEHHLLILDPEQPPELIPL